MININIYESGSYSRSQKEFKIVPFEWADGAVLMQGDTPLCIASISELREMLRYCPEDREVKRAVEYMEEHGI